MPPGLSIEMILKLKFLFLKSLVVVLLSKEDFSLHFNNYDKLRVSIKSIYFLFYFGIKDVALRISMFPQI